MPILSLDAVAGFGAQFVGAAVLALVMYVFQRRYGTSYLHHWTLGWMALALYQVGSVTALQLAFRGGVAASHPIRIVLTVLTGILGFLQIGYFWFGVYELVERRPVRLRDVKRTLILLILMALVISLVSLGPPAVSSTRYFSRVGVRAMVAAAAYFAAFLALWRVRGRRPGVGVSLLSIVFLFYALEQVHYLGIATSFLFGMKLPAYLPELGMLDFLLQSMLGVGMIACLLEDEREAAELASVEIAHLAYHDALTGLPNRPLFVDRLIVAIGQAHRASQKLAVFFLDLDRFKDINDSLGHSVGDQLLKGVADRISRCIREGDTVARFGGDEFTLLIPKLDNFEDVAKIAQKVIDTLKIPFAVGERELFVTTSIGIAIYPADGNDAETLIRNSDTAMYRAKDSGRDNYQLYAPAMNARALERLALENMLRKALRQQELVLHYQPVVNAQTKTIAGVEALLRWQHPELGLLLPVHFITVAELSGLITPIGEWVLRTACRQARTWQKRMNGEFYVAVNLSARQFQQPDLLDVIRSAITDTGIHPSSLELEITESNAMQNAENTIHILRELKGLGVRIAMDDFGTGYSSMNYLKKFPIDTLKLDQSFVKGVTTDARDAAIVSAVISMAHSLELHVVAEGVETEAQLDYLLGQRCDRIQGFYFSRPLDIAHLEPYIDAHRVPVDAVREA